MVKKLLLMDTAVYLNLHWRYYISQTHIYQLKDVAKIVTVPTADIFEFGNKLDGNLKVSFFAGQKLIDCLKYFDIHNLTGTLHCYDEGGWNGSQRKLVIRDHSLEIILHCADVSLGFTTMSDHTNYCSIRKR